MPLSFCTMTGWRLRCAEGALIRQLHPFLCPRVPSRRHLLLQGDNISTIVKAAGITVEPYWPSLFAKLFSKKSVEDLICNVGAGAAAMRAPPADIHSQWRVQQQHCYCTTGCCCSRHASCGHCDVVIVASIY